MENGEVAWYKTGVFSASRVKILRSYGSGACLCYVVRFIDTSPEQPSSEEGISVSARNIVPMTDQQKQFYKIYEKHF